MNDRHLSERELILAGSGEIDDRVEAHLQWCAQCQSAVAEYQWLQSALETTLSTAAEAVPVPRPRWWNVQASLQAGRRRRGFAQHISAIAAVLLAFGIQLSLIPNWGASVAAQHASQQPQLVIVPSPAPPTALVAKGTGSTAALSTSLPSAEAMTGTPAPTLAPVLPPTPPSTSGAQ